MTPDAVLLDCVGVIVDTEGPTFVLLQQNFAAYGLTVSLHDLGTNLISGTMADVKVRAERRRAPCRRRGFCVPCHV